MENNLSVFFRTSMDATPCYYQPLVPNSFSEGALGIEIKVPTGSTPSEPEGFPYKVICRRIEKSGKRSVWAPHGFIETGHEESPVLPHRVERSMPEWEVGDYECELHLNDSFMGQITFRVQEQVPFGLLDCHLYEAPSADHYEPNLDFTSHFDMRKARFICAEAVFNLFSENAREYKFEFVFKNAQTNGTVGHQVVFKTVLPNEQTFSVRWGYGDEKQGGLWQAGSYVLEVRHGDFTFASIPFECFYQNLEKEAKTTVPPRRPKEIDYELLKPEKLKPFPERIDEKMAAIVTYKDELDKIADYIAQGLSVLVVCDKILVEFIYEYICQKANKQIISDYSYDLAKISEQLAKVNSERVMLLRSLDLLDSYMGIFILYHTQQGQNAQLLAFRDPSLGVQKVLTNRFAVHVSLEGLPRRIFEGSYYAPNATKPGLDIFEYLVTQSERACFDHFSTDALYKQVVSLNVLQFRQAMQYIGTLFKQVSSSTRIFREIRQFKVGMIGDDIEIPKTTFTDIGGYEDVKMELTRVIRHFIQGHSAANDKVEVRSKGFIFHGPPGTGKTLFAKAIANELNATIQMISGPEIMDKWVGQSEANMRQIFAIARRNAPSVILFDEFDSIAHKRGNTDDGGARVGNSLMAQLLTELDGFREEDGILIIGTTNRLDIIDKALLRPSRLTPIEIGLPDFDARRRVAEIHAKSLDIDRAAKEVFELANKHLDAWKTNKNELPSVFVEELFERHALVKARIDYEKEVGLFRSDLLTFFRFVASASKSHQQQEDAVAAQMKSKLMEIGKKYEVDLAEVNDMLANAEVEDHKTWTQTQLDLFSLFKTLEQTVLSTKNLSPDAYFASLLNLIAHYTHEFNNDEIRAIFQDAYIDVRDRGQVITPRYFGQKIGMVRRRKEENK